MGIAHVRIALKGQVSSGKDVWSCGFSLPPIVGVTQSDLEDLALAAVTGFYTDFWTPCTLLIPPATTLLSATAQAINAAGQVTVSGDGVFTSAAPGTSSSPSLPPECSIVVSLRTGQAGPRGRGRMYLPPFATNALAADGQITSTCQSTVADGMQDFMDTWNAAPPGYPVSVASNAGLFVAAVDNIKVGRTVDSQRRRRNTIPEGYISRVIT